MSSSANLTPHPPPGPQGERSPVIDMLKAVACMAIVWHHLAFYGPMSDIAQPLAPRLMAWLSEYARMAVQVFLVLGGYLAVASLAPHGVARFKHAGVAISRRFVRLVVPYAVALLVTVLVSAVVRQWMDHPSVPDAPSAWQLLANALLLQDLVGQDALSAGVWYVAIDFQLFSVCVLLWAALRRMPGTTGAAQAPWLAQAMVVVLCVASLGYFNRRPEYDMWAVYFFGAYGLGMMAYWAVHTRHTAGWLAVMVVLGGGALILEYRERVAVALASALLLVGLLRSPQVLRWSHSRMAAPWVGWGQRSYSVFLVHFSVCLLANAVVSVLWPAWPLANALGMVVAFVLSLLAGLYLYLRVEQKLPTWSTAFRWQLGMVGAGLLVALVDNAA